MSSDAERLLGVRTLVHGAANGIGEAVARTCARHGAEVLAVDSRDTDIETRFKGVSQVAVAGLSQGDAVDAKAVVQLAGERLGGLDAVVLCTGLQPGKPMADAGARDSDQRRRLDFLAASFDAALPLLKNSPAGRFIAVGPLRSAFARDAQTLCDDAAQALAECSRALAARSGRFGITVNCIQPGAIMTAESRRVFSDDKGLRDYCIKRSAANRIGEALDVAKAALFLLSDDATFVSGSLLVVDGGRA